jgi:hypothetical protein
VWVRAHISLSSAGSASRVPWRWRSADASAGVLLASQRSQILVEKWGCAYALPSPSSAPPRYEYANVREPARGGGWRTRSLCIVCVCRTSGTTRMLEYLCTTSTSMAVDADAWWLALVYIASFAFRRNYVVINLK